MVKNKGQFVSFQSPAGTVLDQSIPTRRGFFTRGGGIGRRWHVGFTISFLILLWEWVFPTLMLSGCRVQIPARALGESQRSESVATTRTKGAGKLLVHGRNRLRPQNCNSCRASEKLAFMGRCHGSQIQHPCCLRTSNAGCGANKVPAHLKTNGSPHYGVGLYYGD